MEFHILADINRYPCYRCVAFSRTLCYHLVAIDAFYANGGPPVQLRTKLILLVSLVVCVSYGITFYRTADFQEELVVEQATRQAKMLFNQIRLTRQWIADHNGLFLIKEPGVESNPFLDDGEVQDVHGNWLVKRNPAMVTRELSLYAAREGMGQFNVTSLKPVNPLNAPDDFERQSLRKFDQGAIETIDIEKIAGNYRLRYMAPLTVDQRCLGCHGKQGYQVGDIRGGMNVTIPMDWAYEEIRANNLQLLMIALLTIIGVSLSIILLFNHLVARRLKKLSGAMDRYPEAPLGSSLAAESGDEIGHLTERFVELCQRLERSQKELDRTREQVFWNEKQAALGRLVAGISHEINNPLGGMQNCLQTLERHQRDPDRQARYLTLLGQGIERIKGTVQQLLNIGRKEPLSTTRGDIDELLRDCLELSCLGHNRIALDLQLGVDRPVVTGMEALRQVILNLAGNAVQAIGDRSGTISLSSSLEDGQLHIRLCDTGPGIDPEHLETIFEPFFTTKEVGQGTGLGLSVSRSLIEQLGGTLTAGNRPGGGACFYLEIPLDKTPRDSEEN